MGRNLGALCASFIFTVFLCTLQQADGSTPVSCQRGNSCRVGLGFGGITSEWLLTEPASHGTAQVKHGFVLYTPLSADATEDSFTVTTSDGARSEVFSIAIAAENAGLAVTQNGCPSTLVVAPGGAPACFSTGSEHFRGIRVLSQAPLQSKVLSNSSVCLEWPLAAAAPALLQAAGIGVTVQGLMGGETICTTRVHILSPGIVLDDSLLADFDIPWLISHDRPAERRFSAPPACQACESLTIDAYLPAALGTVEVTTNNTLRLNPQTIPAGDCSPLEGIVLVKASVGARTIFRRIPLIIAPVPTRLLLQSQLLEGTHNATVSHVHVLYSRFSTLAGFENDVAHVAIGQRPSANPLVTAVHAGPGRIVAFVDGNLDISVLDADPAQDASARLTLNALKWVSASSPVWSLQQCLASGVDFPLRQLGWVAAGSTGLIDDGEGGNKMRRTHAAFGLTCSNIEHSHDKRTGQPSSDMAVTDSGAVVVRLESITPMLANVLHGYLAAGGGLVLRGSWRWSDAATDFLAHYGIVRTYTYASPAMLVDLPAAISWDSACAMTDPIAADTAFELNSMPLLQVTPMLHTARHHVVAFWPQHRTLNGTLRVTAVAGSVVHGLFRITRFPSSGRLELDAVSGQYRYHPVYTAGFAENDYFTWTVDGVDEQATIWITGYHPVLTTTRRDWYQVPYKPRHTAARLPAPPVGDARIERVLVAQTHLQEPGDPLQTLVGNRTLTVKVDVSSASGVAPPDVIVELTSSGGSFGPHAAVPPAPSLPAQIDFINQNGSEAYWLNVPGHIVQPGLVLSVTLGSDVRTFNFTVTGGAHMRIFNTEAQMWGTNFMNQLSPDAGQEFLAKTPAATMDFTYVQGWQFDFIVPNPSKAGADECNAEILNSTFNCNGGTGGYSLIGAFIDLTTVMRVTAGVMRSGQAWMGQHPSAGGGLGGSRRATGDVSYGVYFHEIGHGWGLPHSVDDANWPHQEVCGFGCVGNVSAYDPIYDTIIPSRRLGDPENYKNDPMQGGAQYALEEDFYSMHADWNINRNMASIRGDHTKFGNDWHKWDMAKSQWGAATGSIGNDLPRADNVSAHMFVGWVRSDDRATLLLNQPVRLQATVLDVIDPTDPRGSVASGDYTLRITWGLADGTHMVEHRLVARERSSEGPIILSSETRGELVRAELLLTPAVMLNGLPIQPQILHAYHNPVAITGPAILQNNTDFQHVVSPLHLPARLADGSKVTWHSSAQRWLNSASGQIVRPAAVIGDVSLRLFAAVVTPFGETRQLNIRVTISALPAVSPEARAAVAAQHVAEQIRAGLATDAPPSFIPADAPPQWQITLCSNSSAVSQANAAAAGVSVQQAQAHSVPVAVSVRVVHRFTGVVGVAATTARVAPVSHTQRALRHMYSDVKEIQLGTYVSRFALTDEQDEQRPAVALLGEDLTEYGAVGWYGQGAMLAVGREAAGYAVGNNPDKDDTSKHIVQAIEAATMYAPDSRNLAVIRRIPGASLPVLNFHIDQNAHVRTGLSVTFAAAPTAVEVDALVVNDWPVVWISRTLGNDEIVPALQRYVFRGGVVMMTHQVWNLDSTNSARLTNLFSAAGFKLGSYYADTFESTGGVLPMARRPAVLSSPFEPEHSRQLSCPAGLSLNTHYLAGSDTCVPSVDAPVELTGSALTGAFHPVQSNGQVFEDGSGNRLQRSAAGHWQLLDSAGFEQLRQLGVTRSSGPLCGGVSEAPVLLAPAGTPPPMRKASVVEIVQHEDQPLQLAEITFDVLNSTGHEVRLNWTDFTCYVAPFSHWSWYNGEVDGRVPRVHDGDVGTNSEVYKRGELYGRMACELNEPAVVVRAVIDSHHWYRARDLEVRLGEGRGPVGYPARTIWVYEDSTGSLESVTGLSLAAVGQVGPIAGVHCKAWNGAGVSTDLSTSAAWSLAAGTEAISCKLPFRHRVQQVSFTTGAATDATVQLAAEWDHSAFRAADSTSEDYAFAAPAAGSHELFTWTADGQGMIHVWATTGAFYCGGFCTKDIPQLEQADAPGVQSVQCSSSLADSTCGSELKTACQGETGMAFATFATKQTFNRTSWKLESTPYCSAFPGATEEQTAKYPVSSAAVAATFDSCVQSTAHASVAAAAMLSMPIACAARVRAGHSAQCSFETAVALPTTNTLRVIAAVGDSFVSGSITGQTGSVVSVRITLPDVGEWRLQAVDLTGASLDLGTIQASEMPLRNSTRTECSVFSSDVEVGELGGPSVTAAYEPPVSVPQQYVPAAEAVSCSGVAAAVAVHAPPSRTWGCDPLTNAAALLENARDVVETLTVKGGAPVVAGSLRRFANDLLASLNTSSIAVRHRALTAVGAAGVNGTGVGFPNLQHVKAHPINTGSFSPERCALKTRLTKMWAGTASAVSAALQRRSCAAGGSSGRALSSAAGAESCAAWVEALAIVLNTTMPSLSGLMAEVSDAAAFVALDGLSTGYDGTADFLQQYSTSCLNSSASEVQSAGMPCVLPCDAADTSSGCLRQCTVVERAQAVADLYCFEEPCPVKTAEVLEWPACAAAPPGEGFLCLGSDGISYPLEACVSQPSLAQQAAACIAPTPSPSGSASASPSVSGTPDATQPTGTPSTTPSVTPSVSPTSSVSPSVSSTPAATASSSASPSVTPAASPSAPALDGGGEEEETGGGEEEEAGGGEEEEAGGSGGGASTTGGVGSSGLGTGAVIGISIAAVAVLVLAAYGLYVYFGKQGRGAGYSASPQQAAIIPNQQATPNFEMMSPIKATSGGSAV